jgi:hypothetical protein
LSLYASGRTTGIVLFSAHGDLFLQHDLFGESTTSVRTLDSRIVSRRLKGCTGFSET